MCGRRKKGDADCALIPHKTYITGDGLSNRVNLNLIKVVLAEWKLKTPCHANGVFINKC